MSNACIIDLSHFGAEIQLAEQLFALGARTPIVCSLCAIRRKTATLIYRIAHQKSPKKGMLPWDQQWIIRSSVNNLHASIFLGLVQDYLPSEASGIVFAQQFVTAYELYCRIVANNLKPSKREASFDSFRVLDINRAWQITQQYKTHELRFSMCPHCQSRYLKFIQKEEYFEMCPICEVWTDSTGRRRWISSTG